MGEGCTVVLGGEGEGDVLGLGPRVADQAYLGIGDLDVPWALYIIGVYRGPPEVYRGPCMKVTPWNQTIYPTDGRTVSQPQGRYRLVFEWHKTKDIRQSTTQTI